MQMWGILNFQQLLAGWRNQRCVRERLLLVFFFFVGSKERPKGVLIGITVRQIIQNDEKFLLRITVKRSRYKMIM